MLRSECRFFVGGLGNRCRRSRPQVAGLARALEFQQAFLDSSALGDLFAELVGEAWRRGDAFEIVYSPTGPSREKSEELDLRVRFGERAFERLMVLGAGPVGELVEADGARE